MKLLEHFKELSLHPKNAEELKGLILQLAVQGKLTANWREENPDVEPASALLERIEVERQKLIAEKKIKKEKDLPPWEYDDQPFDLPQGWAVERINKIALLKAGGDVPKERFSKEKTEKYNVPIYANGEKNKGLYGFTDKPVVNEVSLTVSGRGTIGYTVLREEPFFPIVRLIVITPISKLVEIKFLKLIIQSADFKNTGTSIPQLTVPMVKKKCIVTLPPLEEQKAIVEVVNTLFAEVEQLEALTKERIQLKESFVVSALNRLTEAENTQEEWNFLQQHFSSFFTEKKNIKSLRETILQLAVQGMLTESWREKNTDVEPASDLFNRIEESKNRLIEQKIFKAKYDTDKFEPLINRPEIPNSWIYVTVGNICELITGATPSKSQPQYFGGNIKWLVSGDIHKGYIHDCEGRITDEGMSSSNCKVLPIDSIMIALNGQGKTRATVALLKTEATCNQSLVAMKPFMDNGTLSEYIYYLLKGKYFQIREITGQKQRRGLNMSLVSQLPIALPPLEEQKAIVEKVNSLMALCDELELQIETSQTQIEQLMQSCLKEVFEH